MTEKNNSQTTKSWGGKRKGAGRPATGRKRRYYYVTDEEHETLTAILRELRGENK